MEYRARKLVGAIFGAGLMLTLAVDRVLADTVPDNTGILPTATSTVCTEHTLATRHAADHTQKQAGYPQDVACWAVRSDTGSYTGYYVGGGCVGRRDYPCPDEGTWGWDYSGWLFPRRVALTWSHGRRYQGGSGYYRTVPKPNLASPSTP
jgi:hypothetical protein